jgi:hypothetical protein
MKRPLKPGSPPPIMVVPKQTPEEIERRVRIREALHDLTAKTVRGKSP